MAPDEALGLDSPESQYRALVENIPGGGVALLDETLRYTRVGGEVFEWFDRQPTELEGRTLDEVHSEAYLEAYEPLFDRALAGERSRFEFPYDGREYEADVVPVQADETVVGVMVLTRDVTDRVAAERALADRTERLERFAAIVSHDLRNPIAVANGRLELFRDTGDESHLDVVETALERMDRLVSDLLTASLSGDVTEAESVSVADVARAAWENVDTGEATLSVESSLTVPVDPSQLQQLFENLFRNAVEHGRVTGHGTGTHDSRSDDDGTVTDDSERAGLEVRVHDTETGFAVEDTGSGIPADDYERVFETGYSTSRNGTGLGLGIVEGIAAAHDWSVRATAGEAGGARFEVTTAPDGDAHEGTTGTDADPGAGR